MWFGLYRHLRQISLHADVNRALLTLLSVCRLGLACSSPPTTVCPYVLDDRHAIDQHVFGFVCRAEVVQSRLIRSILTTIVIRRMFCVLCAGSNAPEVVVDCSCDLNRVENCRNSVEFVTVNS